MGEEIYIALIKTGKGIFILADRDSTFSIIVFESIEKGIAYFEDAYNNNHNRSFEASMSACINHIYFQPSIVKVKSIEDIKNRLAAEKPTPFSLSCVAGFLVGINTRKGVNKIWEQGIKPQLIADVK